MMGWALPGYTYQRDLIRDASGHMALARHDDSGDAVAIRYLPRDPDADVSWPQVIVAAQRLAGLDDRHLAVPRECVQSEHGVAVVRDLVDGVALRALLVEEGAVGPEAALVVLADMLHGLAAAHERGVPHRDCRPGTVLVSRIGGAVLVDAGVARPAGPGWIAAGRPFYLAPEQWDGGEPGPQADIYAATATFFECIVGAPPYFGTDLARLRSRHETAPLPVAALPGALWELAGRGLAKRPQDRPATATEFLAELETAAVHGFGGQWQSRGRAELSRLAAGPQPPFPPDVTTVPGSARSRVPVTAARRAGTRRLNRTVAVAAIAAAFVVGLVKVLPSDTVASDTAADERGSSTGHVQLNPPMADAALPPPRPELLPADSAAGPAPPGQRAAPEVPGNGAPGAPPSVETAGAVPAPPAFGIGIGIGAPTPRAAPPSTPARITALSIDSFREQGSATRLEVHVDTSSPGPVQLFLGYGSGRGGDPDATTVHTLTRQLSGHTSYTLVDERPHAAQCHDYWTVFVSTQPAAGGVRDSAELSGAPCAGTG